MTKPLRASCPREWKMLNTETVQTSFRELSVSTKIRLARDLFARRLQITQGLPDPFVNPADRRERVVKEKDSRFTMNPPPCYGSRNVAL